MCRLHVFVVAMVSSQQGRCGQLQKWPWLFNFPIYYFPTPGIWAGFISFFGQFSSVQSLRRVQLFVTPWTAAYQASLSISNSWGLLKLMSIESLMPSNYATILSPSPPTFNLWKTVCSKSEGVTFPSQDSRNLKHFYFFSGFLWPSCNQTH